MKKLYAILVCAFIGFSPAVAAPNTHSVDSRQGVDSKKVISKTFPHIRAIIGINPSIHVFDVDRLAASTTATKVSSLGQVLSGHTINSAPVSNIIGSASGTCKLSPKPDCPTEVIAPNGIHYRSACRD